MHFIRKCICKSCKELRGFAYRPNRLNIIVLLRLRSRCHNFIIFVQVQGERWLCAFHDELLCTYIHTLFIVFRIIPYFIGTGVSRDRGCEGIKINMVQSIYVDQQTIHTKYNTFVWQRLDSIATRKRSLFEIIWRSRGFGITAMKFSAKLSIVSRKFLRCSLFGRLAKGKTLSTARMVEK